MSSSIIIKLVMAVILCGMIFYIVGNIADLFFSNTTESVHNKRLKQLKFGEKRTSSNEQSTKDFIDKVTKPVVTYILPKLDLNIDKTQLEKELEMAQWDKAFTPVTFLATDILLKIIGVAFFLIVFKKSAVFAIIWFIAFFFLFKFLFHNSIKERRFRLLSQFPEFIQTVLGFLLSKMPLSQAVEHSLPYMGEEWKPLLRDFVVNCEKYSQNECIDILSSKVDIPEIREFWSLIRLNSEQGIDISECFQNQSDKIRELQMQVMEDKIEKRQLLSIAIQGPLLLVMICGFGLPTLYQMTHLGL